MIELSSALLRPQPSSFAATARELVPVLRQRAGAAIAERRAPAESIAALKSAGLTRLLQSTRSRGLEGRLIDHFETVAEAARGCGSTAWCLGVYHAHSWLMGLATAEAQDDVWGRDATALIAAVLSMRGSARRVPGGFKVTGFWPFCSGVHHAQWVLLGCRVEAGEGQAADEGVMLVPAGAFQIKDDWYATGLTGTGSNSVVTSDVIVPAHRFLSFPQAAEGRAPGAELHASTLYRSALVPVLALFITSPVIGMAEHALEDFIGRLPGRVVAHTFDQKQIEMPVTHLQVGEAATKIDLARTRLEATIAEIERAAASGVAMAPQRRAKARMDCAYAVRLCLEAVECIIYAAGASALSETSGVQRAARDVRAAATHGLLNLETNLETYGRVVLGLPANSPTI